MPRPTKDSGERAHETILALVGALPELAWRKSLQQIVWKLAGSPAAERLFSNKSEQALVRAARHALKDLATESTK